MIWRVFWKWLKLWVISRWFFLCDLGLKPSVCLLEWAPNSHNPLKFLALLWIKTYQPPNTYGFHIKNCSWPLDHPKKCGNSSCLRRTPCAPQTMEHYVVVPFLRRLAAFTTSAPRRVSLGGWRNWWLSENQESSSFLKWWYPQIIIWLVVWNMFFSMYWE